MTSSEKTETKDVPIACEEPSIDHLSPCKCTVISNNSLQMKTIHCNDVSGDKVKDVFSKLAHSTGAEKHFHRVILEGQALDQLPKQTFDEITFDTIDINLAPNLRMIHSDAFKTTQIGKTLLSR